MSIRALQKALAEVDISEENPYLILGERIGKRVEVGTYPINEDLADQFREIAQNALDRIEDLDMHAYEGPTLLATGEEGLFVPSERLNSESPLLEALATPDDIEEYEAEDIEDRSFSFYAICFGSSDEDRLFFVKKRARQLKATSAVLAVFRGNLRPIGGNVIAFDRDIDFILCDKGAAVFEANAFERYIQDPADVAQQLASNLDELAETLPFADDTLKQLKAYGMKGTLLRGRIRSILNQPHLGGLTMQAVSSELRRLGREPREYVQRGKLHFSMDKAQFIMQMLDESAWKGGFSGKVYTTNAKRTAT